MFKEGEIVLYTYNRHASRIRKDGSNLHLRNPRTVELKFIGMRTPDSATLEFRTPMGLEHRAVPLKNIAKKESA